MSLQSTSGAKELDKNDWKKTLRDAGFAAASTAVAVLINSIGQLDLGEYTVTVVPLLHFGLVALYRYLRDNHKNVETTIKE